VKKKRIVHPTFVVAVCVTQICAVLQLVGGSFTTTRSNNRQPRHYNPRADK